MSTFHVVDMIYTPSLIPQNSSFQHHSITLDLSERRVADVMKFYALA